VELKLTTSQLKSVQEYCKLNNIEDVDKFISKCFTNGLNIEKYGLLGDDLGKTGIVSEKQVEIEVIREIRVEVPFETIKEVEVIKYVDREVIVEVPVPIIDKIGDETQINELLLKIQQLENRPPEIIETIKEVQVEKIVEVEKPNDKTLLLQETLQTLKKELSLKNSRIKELEEKNKLLESNKISQGAVYLKGSNLNEMM
jgi:hypothetical protein